MLTQIRRSVVLAVIALVLFGLIYPLVGTGLSQLLFKDKANGSITVNGSPLIGQNWTDPRWFHGRPDDLGPYAANPKATPPVTGGDNPLVANGNGGGSGATNLGPRSKTLVNNTEALIAYWHSHGVDPTPDLVTTSGSGLDPDITPQDAYVQIPMVSRARGISSARLRNLISRQTHSAQFGFLGSDYVDVLQLNEALAHLE
jgi:potassium-transporting ATPase KdpC subunit